MPPSKDKMQEIGLFCLKNGKTATLEAYSLTEETFNRYKRRFKELFGEKFEYFLTMNDALSSDELKSLAMGKKTLSHKKVEIDFTGDELKVGVFSDPHFGSRFTDPEDTEAAIVECNRVGVDIIVCPGDLVEGMMGRPGHVFELSHIGYKAQRDEARRVLCKIEKPFYAISGNHDNSFNTKQGAGTDIVEDICSAMPNATYLGFDEGDIHIKGICIRLFHGGDGTGYALSYRGQKYIESLTGGEKPNVIIAGHTHKSHCMFVRNIEYVEAGTLQKQTDWMRGKKIAAHTGFTILDITIGDGGIKKFTRTWYPLYE